MKLIFLFAPALSQCQADAHAFLMKSNPAVGSVLNRNPAELRLEFSEPVELAFSGIDLMSAAGQRLQLNSLHFADDSHKVLVAVLPMIMPGNYRVRWHVVSVDTHRTEGEFAFTIRP